MAATLVLSDSAKEKLVLSLKFDLNHVFLGRDVSVNLDADLTTSMQNISSDGSSTAKQLRFAPGLTEYKTNNILGLDEDRITNFFIRYGFPVNKLVLINTEKVVKGIITFDTITPDEDKSLYVKQIKINVL